MRRSIIAGNWKMYKTCQEAEELVKGLIGELEDTTDVEIVLCPPFTALYLVSRLISETNLILGAQNFYPEDKGGFTGEISALMLRELGCKYIIIGHSERREYFAETNLFINKKIRSTLAYRLSPILCVGERLEEREAGREREVVYEQLIKDLAGLTAEEMAGVVIAYEPVWAIGTGKTASPEDARAMHLFIRKTISQMYSRDLGQKIRIQYGGSVKPDNIDRLMADPDIDGALVGGASLEVDSFSRIVKFKRDVIVTTDFKDYKKNLSTDFTDDTDYS